MSPCRHFAQNFSRKGKEGWKRDRGRGSSKEALEIIQHGKVTEACMGCEKQKKNPERRCREGSEYHFICYIIIILHSPHMFPLHSTCQIAVAEGPSQQERDHLFLLLTDAGSTGCGQYLFWVDQLFLMKPSELESPSREGGGMFSAVIGLG